MKQSIIQRIALLFPQSGSLLTEVDDFDDEQSHYLESLLPSGSGIDSGMKIDIEKSNRNEITLTGDYHYMDDNGFYAGWFGFSVVIASDLAHGPHVKDFSITYNNTELDKEWIVEFFGDYLSETVSYTCFEPKKVKLGESHPVFI